MARATPAVRSLVQFGTEFGLPVKQEHVDAVFEDMAEDSGTADDDTAEGGGE